MLGSVTQINYRRVVGDDARATSRGSVHGELAWLGFASGWRSQTLRHVSKSLSTTRGVSPFHDVTSVASPGETSLRLLFDSTQSNEALAISDIRLMRPTTENGPTPYPESQLFTDQIQTLLSKFQVIRFMDYLETNDNPIQTWSQRTRPSHASMDRGVAGTGDGGDRFGGALEYAVMLCNTVQRDLWINVPIGAGDDYITKMGQLVAFGSDGVNPYTSATSGAVFPPLDPGLKVYVEYSNEIWNGQFGQYAANRDTAVAEAISNPTTSPLMFDGAIDPAQNPHALAARRSAVRTIQISNLLRNVFGDSPMMTRVRPILAAQFNAINSWALQQAHMLHDYYNTRLAAGNRPPSYYIYGGGGSAYYDPESRNPTLRFTASNGIPGFWDSRDMDPEIWRPKARIEATYALSLFGHRVAYEGGPNLNHCTCSGQLTCWCEATQIASWSSSQMTPEVIEHQQQFDETGGELLVYFQAAVAAEGDYFRWAFTHDPYSIATFNSPKLAAITSINATPKAPSNAGSPWPGSQNMTGATAPRTLGPETESSSPLDLHANGNWTWINYLARTPEDSFDVVLKGLPPLTGTAGTPAADVYIDGARVGTVQVVTTGARLSEPLRTPPLTAGSHGILVKATTGAFGLESIITTAVGGAAAPVEEPSDDVYVTPPPIQEGIYWLSS
jgi:hypothetical protein